MCTVHIFYRIVKGSNQGSRLGLDQLKVVQSFQN